MKNELGITKGEFTVEEYGHCIAIEVKIKDGTIHTVFTDQFCHASRFDGTGKDNAILVSEAFNIANETGKTPRQLADDNKVLLEACQIAVGDIERNEKKFSSEEKLSILRKAIKQVTE